jgi:MFS family permease
LKRSYATAVVLRSGIALLFVLAGSPWLLFTLRSVLGVAQTLREPAADALIAEYGGKRAIASAFAWYATARKVATSLGAAVAGSLLTLTARGFPQVFVFAFVLSLLPLYVVLRYVPRQGRVDKSAPTRPPAAPARHPFPDCGADARTAGVRPALPPLVVLGMLVSGAAQMLRGMLPILMTQYAGMSDAQAGIAYLASSVAVLGSGPLFGWMADHVSQPLVLTVRSLANTISSTIFLAAPNPPGLVIGLVVDDVGKSAFRPAWGALMARVASFNPRRRAQTMGWMGWGEDVGEVAGPIVTGFVWGAWGIAAVLGLRILLAVGTEVYATLLMRGLERRTVPRDRRALVDKFIWAPAMQGAAGERPARADAAAGARRAGGDG